MTLRSEPKVALIHDETFAHYPLARATYMMHSVAAFALLSLIVTQTGLSQNAPDAIDRAGILQSQCKLVASADLSVGADGQQMVSYPTTYETGICRGSFQMIQRFAGTTFAVCSSPNSTMSQYVRIFDKYVTTHPERLNDDAATVVLDALREAFPCKNKNAKKP